MAQAVDTRALLDAYLVSQGLVARSIVPLTGGSANYIWRVGVDITTASHGQAAWVRELLQSLQQSASVATPNSYDVIVKHAEPFVAVNPAISFPVDRMVFEANALRTTAALLGGAAAELAVATPTVYHFDAERHMICMSDGGSQNLKEACTNYGQAQICDIGRRLGQWLALLHARSRDVSIGEGGNATGKAMYRHAYNRLDTALRKWELDEGLAQRVNDTYGAMLATDNVCVCMGDFWPANIIVADEGSALRATVVDWEMTRRGCGATDVAQFAAESYLLDRFRAPSHGLARAFVRAYMAAASAVESPAPASSAFLTRIGVHFGTHITYWPSRVRWADDEATKELALFGVSVIERAIAGDHAWMDEL